MKRFGAILFLLVLPFAELQAAEDIEIRSLIQIKAGEKYRFWGELKDFREFKIQLGGKVKEDSAEKKVVTLQGTVEILVVDEDGDPVKSSLTVQSMKEVRKQNEKPEVMLPAGTVVIAEFKEKRTVYSVKDVEVSPELGRAFRQLFNLLEFKGVAGEKIIGTKEKRKPTEQWPVNAEAVVEELAGFEFKKEDVTGNSRFDGVSRWGWEVVADVEVKNVTAKEAPAMEDMKVKESTMRYQVSNSLPTLEGLSVGKGKGTKLSAAVTYKGERIAPDGQRLDLNFSYGMARSATYSLIK